MTRIHVSKGALVGVLTACIVAIAVTASAQGNPDAAKIKNPVKATPESIKAGETNYGKYCKFCHGNDATGNVPLAPKGTNPPSLVDAKWDHGSTDGEIFTTIKNGIGPKFDMDGFKETLSDKEIWTVINYLRSIGPAGAKRE